MKLQFNITETQWVHVIACTAMTLGVSQSPWGLLAFPVWYGVAVVFGSFPP